MKIRQRFFFIFVAVISMVTVCLPALICAQSDFEIINVDVEFSGGSFSGLKRQKLVEFSLPDDVDTTNKSYLILLHSSSRDFNFIGTLYLNPTFPNEEEPSCENNDEHRLSSYVIATSPSFVPVSANLLKPGINRLLFCYKGFAEGSPRWAIGRVILHYKRQQ